MIRCRVSPLFETDDFRRAVSTVLVEAGFRETADEYWRLTMKARSPDEAIVSPPLPSMIELDWGVTFERSEEAAIQELVLSHGD